MAPGLLPLQDQPADPPFQGQAQQPFVAGNINYFDALCSQADGVSRVPGGDGHEGGADGLDPGQLFFQGGVFGQGDEVNRVGPGPHEAMQAAEISLQLAPVSEAQGNGGEAAGLGHRQGEFGDIADPGHGALDKRIRGAQLPGRRAVQKTPARGRDVPQQPGHLGLESLHGLGAPGAEALTEPLGKGGFRTQGDQAPAVQTAFQGGRRGFRHLLGKGAALGRGYGAVAQRAGVTLQFFDGREIAFIEKPAEHPQGAPHQAGMLGTELGDLLPEPVVYLHQVSPPVETFKDDARGAGGQEGRRGLGGSYSTPDDHLHFKGAFPQPLFGAGEQHADGVPTYEARSLVAFEGYSPDGGLVLNEEVEEVQITDNRQTGAPGRELVQPLEKYLGGPGEEVGVVFHPQGFDPRFLQEDLQLRVHQVGGKYLNRSGAGRSQDCRHPGKLSGAQVKDGTAGCYACCIHHRVADVPRPPNERKELVRTRKVHR